MAVTIDVYKDWPYNTLLTFLKTLWRLFVKFNFL